MCTAQQAAAVQSLLDGGVLDAVFEEGARAGSLAGTKAGAEAGWQAASKRVNLELRTVLVKAALVGAAGS